MIGIPLIRKIILIFKIIDDLEKPPGRYPKDILRGVTFWSPNFLENAGKYAISIAGWWGEGAKIRDNW